jgi:anti-sigma factor RsiW
MKLTPQHIPFARLADLVEGRLPAAEQASARAHLDACARCAGQAAQLARVTDLMRTDTSADAPRDVVADAVRLFDARRTGQPAHGLLRRLVASLTFDSNALAPAFGVRSGQAAEARQLLFSAGGLDVDLRLAPAGEGWAVSGQVLGPCAGGRAEMTGEGEGRAAAHATLNDLCEFKLPPLPAGNYTLRLLVDDAEVEIPGLDLRA